MTPEQMQFRIDMREAAYSAIAKYEQLRQPKEHNKAAVALAGHVLFLLEEIDGLETAIKQWNARRRSRD